MERGDAFGLQDITRAYVAAALRDDLQESNRGFYSLRNRDGTECDGAGTIAADGNPHHIAAVICSRFEPHVCRNGIKAERTSAVEDDGILRRQLRRERSLRQLMPEIGGECIGIKYLCRVDSSQGIGQNRNAVDRDAECRDRVGKARRRGSSKTAHLNAAACGDFDDAAAVGARGGAQRGESIKRGSAGRQKPDQKSIAGRHWYGKPGTRAAPFPSHLWGGVRGGGREICYERCRHHTASRRRSAARAASISLRRGCQKPCRRASSNRSAIATAACGFSRSRKSRTVGSAA